MSVERILEKIRKLQRLATSANVNEAALAAERVQELLIRHELSLAERPRVVVVNKADRLPETERNRLARELGAVVVSAQDPGSLPPLRQAIADALDRARPVTSWASPSG